MNVNANAAHIFLFDLTNHVHFPMFVRCWLTYWRERKLGGQLTLFVSRHFMRTQPELVQLAECAPYQNIRFLTPTAPERAKLRSFNQPTDTSAINFTEMLRTGQRARYDGVYIWELFCKYAHEVGADHNVLCHMDHHLPVMISGVSVPPSVSGIYFHPHFHYDAFSSYQKRSSASEAAESLRQKFILSRVLRQTELRHLFVLDPYVRQSMTGFPNPKKIVYLPEPVVMQRPTAQQVEALRHRLGIERQNRVCLAFGSISRRKGVDIAIDALARLPYRVCKRLCLVVAGTIASDYRSRIDELLDWLERVRPIRIIRRFGFVPEADIAAFFDLADLVLTPYRQHSGPSNVNLLAAAAARPVLSSDYGLVGEIVRQYKLGLAVDTADREQVTQALEQLLDSPSQYCDPRRMQDLVAGHEPQTFARIFFSTLQDASGALS